MARLTRKLNLEDHREGPASKSNRAGGAEDDKEDEGSLQLRQMVVHLQKLSIQGAQSQRELAACLWNTGLVPVSTKWAQLLIKANKQYMIEVKDNPGHGLGPPFHHVAAAWLEGVQADLAGAVAKDSAKKKDLDFVVAVMAKLFPSKGQGFDPEVVVELFSMFKAREIFPRKPGKGKGKGSKAKPSGSDEIRPSGSDAMEIDAGGGGNQPDRILVQFALEPFTSLVLDKGGIKGIEIGARLRQIFRQLVVEAGGEVTTGGAPPGRSERLVFSDHRRLAKTLS